MMLNDKWFRARSVVQRPFELKLIDVIKIKKQLKEGVVPDNQKMKLDYSLYIQKRLNEELLEEESELINIKEFEKKTKIEWIGYWSEMFE